MKEEERYSMKADEVTILSIPQCNTCSYNLGFSVCEKFEKKPAEYIINEAECPHYNPL